MFCPICGYEMSEEALFCSNCGWSKKGNVNNSKTSIRRIFEMQNRYRI